MMACLLAMHHERNSRSSSTKQLGQGHGRQPTLSDQNGRRDHSRQVDAFFTAEIPAPFKYMLPALEIHTVCRSTFISA